MGKKGTGTKSSPERHCNAMSRARRPLSTSRIDSGNLPLMVSPRLRHAVPLPLPIDTTRLRQVLAVEIVAMLATWSLPALLLPPPWLTTLGIAEPATEQLLFVRLWGAACFAIVVGQALAWRAPLRHPSAILIGIVGNGMGALVIVSLGTGGAFAAWPRLGVAYAWGSALLMAGIATALAVTGQPLLRRLVDRQRPGSVKVM